MVPRLRPDLASWLALAAVLVVVGAGCGAGEPRPGDDRGRCVPNPNPLPTRPTPSPPTLPFLRVAGADIVDEAGARVALRGVNFGSWLQVESWINGIGVIQGDELTAQFQDRARELGIDALIQRAMGPHLFDLLGDLVGDKVVVEQIRTDSYALATAAEKPALDELWAWFDAIPWIFDEQSLWDYLWGRFGRERAEELRATLVAHWITEDDARRVAELGLNFVRVPVWYQALDDETLPVPAWRLAGWNQLHEVLEWARRHRLYVLLDLHGAPGGQSAADHAGLPDGNYLWSTPACVDKAAALWQALATWFADDPHVLGFDLLNEPMGAPDAATYRAVHDALYQAIRAVDSRHIVWIEHGYLAGDLRVAPAEMGWENAAYQVHIYVDAASAEEYEARFVDELLGVASDYDRYGCPLLIGEFSTATSAAWGADGLGRVFGRMNAAGIHWAPWTWKYRVPGDTWGLYTPPAATTIDVANASFEEIQAAFAGFDSAGYVPNADYAARFAEHAAAAAQPLDFGVLR